MLLDIAIGDAYGAGFEFAPQEEVDQFNTVTEYRRHHLGGDTALPAGCYTDDTQMSIALSEVLFQGGPYTRESFAEAFVSAFRRDPRKGYAGRFYDLLVTCETGADLLSKIHPDSIRNGAMMRSVPLGLLPDAATVLRVADIQASITHDTFIGRLSSQVTGLMAHALLQGERISKLPDIVRRDLHYTLVPRDSAAGRVACDAGQTLQAVWTVLSTKHTAVEMLKESISYGGDTDSVAAVAMGLASLTDEIESFYPTFLLTGLEASAVNKDYGLEFLNSFDVKLLSLRIFQHEI